MVSCSAWDGHPPHMYPDLPHKDKDGLGGTRGEGLNPSIPHRTQSAGSRIVQPQDKKKASDRLTRPKAWSEEWTHVPAPAFAINTLRSPDSEISPPMAHSSPRPSNWPSSQIHPLLLSEKSKFPRRQTETSAESGHVGQTLSQSLSVSLSLDTDIAAYDDSFGTIRYPQPQIPMMSPKQSATSSQSSGIMSSDWRRVIKLRERVQNLRLQIQDQRTVVQSRQEAKSDADEKYIKVIRTRHVRCKGSVESDSEVTALEELWRQCQAARDAYGPAEDALNAMEDRLENEEAKLSQAEGQLYTQLSPPRDTPAALEDSETFDDTSDQSSVDSEPEYEPLYEDYLRRLGNQDLLLESYGGLVNEKNRLEAERERRRQVGVDLDDEDLEFLAKWASTIEPVREELEEVTKDVERLKNLCIAQGLIDGSEPPTQPSETYEEHNQDLDEHPQSDKNSTHSKPSQPENATSNNEASSSTKISQEYEPESVTGINSWLLDKLRSSSVEITLLTSFIIQKVSGMDSKSWQLEVLRLWDNDGAGLGEPVDDAQTPVTSAESSQTHDLRSDNTRYDNGLLFVELDDIPRKASSGDASFSSAGEIKTEILCYRIK
jgi:hypothetical protein